MLLKNIRSFVLINVAEFNPFKDEHLFSEIGITFKGTFINR
jgi:hypothetical protein